MKKINWKTRVKHKTFWVGIVSAILVLAQSVLPQLEGSVVNIINAVFSILAILGIVVDPTTAGFGDSANALTYEEPKKSDDTTEALG